MTGEAFDPVAAEFTFLLDGWSAHGKAFSTAPDTWLGVWRLHDARGEWVQTLAMSPDSYMTARMAASSNGRLHAAIVRIPKKDGPKTFEYLTYDGATWSTPVQLSLSRPIKSLYDLASNRSGQILIVYASTDGKLVARSIVDRAPAGAAPVVRPEAEPVPLYKSKSGALGLVVPIALSDIGAEATAAGTAIAVADHRAAIVMERTAMGRPMGLVDLEPGERELVSALVTTKWKGALGKRGLDHYEPQLSCELQEFSVTTPGTMFYWDVSTRVQWVLHLGDQQRTVTAASKRRTFVWPSKTLIKEVTVAAMKSASAQTEQAIGELLAAASP
jgi:hypothetical protein